MSGPDPCSAIVSALLKGVRISFEAPNRLRAARFQEPTFLAGYRLYSASDEKIDELDQDVIIRVNNRVEVGGIGDNSVVLVRMFEYTPML